jgi:putative ABC transport system permease protein
MSKWIAGWEEIHVDGWVLALALLLSVMVGCGLGVVTALRASRLDLSSALRETGAGAAGGTRREQLRSMLVVAQVVAAMVLLVGAGLMMKGFARLVTIYQGLEPAPVETAQISLPKMTYSDDIKIVAFYDELLRGMSTLPGVQSAGIAENIPASNVDNPKTVFTIEGRPTLQASEVPVADVQSIGGDFLRSLRVPLLAGRMLSEHDGRKAPRVAVISKGMAARFWPGEDPLGKRIKLGEANIDMPWVTIAGIVRDVKQNWWDPQPRPTIYLPYQQAPQSTMNIVVRTFDPSATVLADMHAVVQNLDAEVGLNEIQSMEGVVSDSLAPVRIIGVLMIVFGAVALALSLLGVYGAVAQSVAQRTREFGIRIAVGARPSGILQLVIGHALKLSCIGLALAFPLCLLLSHAMASLLFGVVTLNLMVLVVLAVLMVLAALAASYVPARRAARVDPVVALRYE